MSNNIISSNGSSNNSKDIINAENITNPEFNNNENKVGPRLNMKLLECDES